jgi:hypothetical protein
MERSRPVAFVVMDELARRYLLLGLRLDRISPGFVDSYVGPSELREIAASEVPPFAAEIHDETLALRELADSLPGDDPDTRRRRLWFHGQLRAMSALARRAGGEEISYMDLVEQLFALPVRPIPDEQLDEARRRLENALPGRGDLQERLATQRASLRIPPEQAVAATVASAQRFRDVSRRDFELPDHEEIDWLAVHDQPWGAYACFLGHGRTSVEINIDLPMEVSGAAHLASHEAYPGHHAEHIVKEQTLMGRDHGEVALRTMNTPESVLSEGQADLAREIVMSNRELEDELRRIGQAAGVDGDWAATVAVRDALNDLINPAVSNAGILLHHEGRSEAEVRVYLTDMGLPRDRLDHTIRILNDPVSKTYSFTYSEGVRLIRPWLELQGQTTGFWRLLSEQLSPAALLADLEAAAPVGGLT